MKMRVLAVVILAFVFVVVIAALMRLAGGTF